ncbi:hypothetical protein PG996_005944 [Apiospora saccharicola]|uniref:Uncharacterized protein n=1 Tax=Apiospora saccharicola TaxID=335842 RepID=A0ABR1VMW6_9PEZI
MLLLQEKVTPGFPMKPPPSAARPGSNRSWLPCPPYNPRQRGPGRRICAPRTTKRYGYIGYKREGLVAIPEEEPEGEEGQRMWLDHCRALQERGFASKAKDSTHYYHPDAPLKTHKNVTHQFQQVEGERCPVALRWESPKSTIQLEDLLFGIGSQFDKMPFSPRQLSYIHASSDHNPVNGPLLPSPSFTSSIAPLLVDKGEEGSSRLLLQYEDLPAATAAPRLSAGSSYLRCLSMTLASTMRRVCIGLWKMVRWRECNGIRGSSRRRQQQQGGHEKHGGRCGVIYLA